jgi:triacylglycerol lipase
MTTSQHYRLEKLSTDPTSKDIKYIPLARQRYLRFRPKTVPSPYTCLNGCKYLGQIMESSLHKYSFSQTNLMIALILCLLASVAYAGDHVVFVHGLAGFGPSELLGLNYWGMSGFFGSSQDYFAPFRSAGFTPHYAVVGPISSNHDRACELYAQIKGTKVDYGKAHSAQFSHAQFGIDYTNRGFYTSWSGSNKIHFVGHSMGGNTIRYLEYLLQKGLAAEVSASGSAVSDVFKSPKPTGGNWIQSVTTISTPHDGSTLIPKLGSGLTNFIKDLIAFLAGIVGLTGGVDWAYDFKLNQFGLSRGSGESFSSYQNRVFASPIFSNGFSDLASYDLSTEWSRTFNTKTALTYAGTFYFSVSTKKTFSCWNLLEFRWDQCPDADMVILLSPTSLIIGDMQGTSDKTGYAFGSDWNCNDGVVPCRSSASPQIGVNGYVAPQAWPSSGYTKGHWYTQQVSCDHLEVIGARFWLLNTQTAGGAYNAIASALSKCTIALAPAAGDDGEADTLPEGELDAGSIAGIAIGCVAGLALLVALVVKRHQIQQNLGQRLSRGKSAEAVEQVASVVAENPVFTKEQAPTV